MCFKGGVSMNAKNDLESTLDRLHDHKYRRDALTPADETLVEE